MGNALRFIPQAAASVTSAMSVAVPSQLFQKLGESTVNVIGNDCSIIM